jgi:hypothetical protein
MKNSIQLARAMANLTLPIRDAAWTIVIIRPSGVYIEGPYTLSVASKKRSHILCGSMLMRSPLDPEIPAGRMGLETGYEFVLTIDEDEIVGMILKQYDVPKAVLDDNLGQEWGWRPAP